MVASAPSGHDFRTITYTNKVSKIRRTLDCYGQQTFGAVSGKNGTSFGLSTTLPSMFMIKPAINEYNDLKQKPKSVIFMTDANSFPQ
jgi:hypothetical protein